MTRSLALGIFTGFLLIVISVIPSLAVEEENLKQEFDSSILPYFKSEFEHGWFYGAGDAKLRYTLKRVEREKAAVVFVSGRTEYVNKYAELFYDLEGNGFSYFIYDHRGQGSSDRLLPDRHKGYVKKFDHYIEDLDIFLDSFVYPRTNAPVFIVSHSMGGMISFLYASQKPEHIAGLILCAPMFSINTAPFPNMIAKLLAKSMDAVGKADSYVFGGTSFNPKKEFAGNDLTQSRARFTLNIENVVRSPDIALGSPTFGWLNQSFQAMERLLNSNYSRVPQVLILSGTDDTVVKDRTQKEVCEKLPSCTFKSIEGGRHELLMEKDSIRDQVIKELLAFMNKK